MKRELIGVLVLLILLGNVSFVVAAQDSNTGDLDSGAVSGGAGVTTNGDPIKAPSVSTIDNIFNVIKNSWDKITNPLADWWNQVYNKGKSKALDSLCSYFPKMSSCISKSDAGKPTQAFLLNSQYDPSIDSAVLDDKPDDGYRVWRVTMEIHQVTNAEEIVVGPADKCYKGGPKTYDDGSGIPLPCFATAVVNDQCLASNDMYLYCDDKGRCAHACYFQASGANQQCWAILKFQMVLSPDGRFALNCMNSDLSKDILSKTWDGVQSPKCTNFQTICHGEGTVLYAPTDKWPNYTRGSITNEIFKTTTSSKTVKQLNSQSDVKFTAIYIGNSNKITSCDHVTSCDAPPESGLGLLPRTSTTPEPGTPNAPGGTGTGTTTGGNTETPTTPGENATTPPVKTIPNCVDHLINQDETGIDCGGEICEARCNLFVGCRITKDCKAGLFCASTPIGKTCQALAENKHTLNFSKGTIGGRTYGGYTVQIAWQGVTFEWPISNQIEPGIPIGGISAIFTAGADAAFTPSTIKNTYGNSFNPNAKVNTSDSSINATVRIVNVNGTNVTVVDLKVDPGASGNKTITVELTGKDNNGNTVPIGTAKINAEIKPAPSSSQTFVVSGIVLGSLLSLGILAWMYFKQSASEAIQMMTP